MFFQSGGKYFHNRTGPLDMSTGIIVPAFYHICHTKYHHIFDMYYIFPFCYMKSL